MHHFGLIVQKGKKGKGKKTVAEKKGKPTAGKDGKKKDTKTPVVSWLLIYLNVTCRES